MVHGPGPSSDEELIERFNEYLMRAVASGRGCTHSGSWIDELTTMAIEKVAAAQPNPDPELIDAARDAFARQRDGTHRRERGAHFYAQISHSESPWPLTAFAVPVSTGFGHALNRVNDPWGWGEIDRARADLEQAAPHVSGNPNRQLVLKHLDLMLDELTELLEHDIGRELSHWPKELFLTLAETSLTLAVRFVEQTGDDELAAAQHFLDVAAGITPGSTQTQRDFGIVVDHLGRILAGLQAAPGGG